MKKLISILTISIISQCSMNIENCLSQWIQSNGPHGGQISVVCGNGNDIYAGSTAGSPDILGIYKSTNNGIIWMRIGLEGNVIYAIEIDTNNQMIYAAAGGAGIFDKGIYKKPLNDTNWTFAGMLNIDVKSIGIAGNYIFAGADGIYRSSDQGASWTPVGLSGSVVRSIEVSSNNIFVGAGNIVYLSTNNGDNWSTKLTTFGSYVHIALNGNNIVAASNSTSTGIYYSSNNGNNWSSTNSVRTTQYVHYYSNNFFASGDTGIYRSSNNGANWIKVSSGLNNNTYIPSISSNYTGIYCGGSYASQTITGIYYSANLGNNWERIGLPTEYISSLVLIGNTILAGTQGDGIFRSTNNGNNWIPSSNGLPFESIGSMAFNGSYVFAGLRGFSSIEGGIYKSSNNGLNWVYTGLSNVAIDAVAASGNNVFAGDVFDLYKSINGGDNWVQTSYNHGVNSILIKGDTILVGRSGVYISFDNGSTWSQTSLTANIACLAMNGNSIYAGAIGANAGIYKSTNNGANWSLLGLSGYRIQSILIDGSNIFAGVSGSNYNGVYLTTNDGVTWIEKNQGFNQIPGVTELLIAGNDIFAGTSYFSVWHRSLSEIIGIQNISAEVPSGFSLKQNFPNPFNPITNIKFDVPKKSFVKLLIYDLLGREVETLVNEVLNTGSYQTDWNASEYPSGVYFYRIQTEDFVQTKSMVLLK